MTDTGIPFVALVVGACLGGLAHGQITGNPGIDLIGMGAVGCFIGVKIENAYNNGQSDKREMAYRIERLEAEKRDRHTSDDDDET